MPKQNVELIRAGYEAWNAGDLDAVAELLDPEVEWLGHPRLPEPGPYSSRDEVRRWLEGLGDMWESLLVRSAVFHVVDESVVVLVQISGQGRGSGIEVESGVDAHIWTFTDGAVVRMRWVTGQELIDGAGLSEEDLEQLRRSVGVDPPADEVTDELLAKLERLTAEGRG